MTMRCLREVRGTAIAVLALFVVFSLVTAKNQGQAASAEDLRVAELIEGAKKEGRVSLYTAMAVESSRALVERFQERHPYVKVDLYRSSNINVLNRILVEAKAKKRINDVVLATGDVTQAIKENGAIARYLSPERDSFPEGFKDPEGYWTDAFLTVHSIAYNTRLVPPREAPIRYKDLLNPRWRGKIGINLNNFMWPLIIIRTMGEQEGIEFLRALARQNPVVRSGGTLTALLVAAGELSLAASINANNVEDVKAKGAPVDWARLKEPFYAELHPISLNALAPHPNAAKLLIDFTISQEGQELMVKFGTIPSRKGMKASYAKVEDIKPLMPTSSKDTAYSQDLMRKTFKK